MLRMKLRKEAKKRGMKNNNYQELYADHRSEIIALLRGLELKKLKVFIEYGLPKKDGSIQVPLNHRAVHQPELGELRVLDGFEIDREISASKLREQLRTRKKEAQERLDERLNQFCESRMCLEADKEGGHTPESQEGRVQAQEDHQIELGRQLPFQISRQRNPGFTSLKSLLSSSVFGGKVITILSDEESPQEPLENESCENDEPKKMRIEHLSRDCRTNVSDQVEKAGGGQFKRQRFNNLTFEVGESVEKLVAKKLSQIAVLEKFRAMTEKERKKALDLAQSARKKSEMYAHQILELKKLIKCIKTMTKF